ncbi:MAG TPA: hypothetical protein VGQ29_10820 [Gemmatimonadales bacterium]|nr:hypothetical protein [Gemmatimonadales bacterium]
MITAALLLFLLQSPNTLSPAEKAAGWRLLFDGRTLTGWRGVGYDTVPTAHWVVVNGAIKKIASGDVPRVADGRPGSARSVAGTSSCRTRGTRSITVT